jgi:hypothetical protein
VAPGREGKGRGAPPHQNGSFSTKEGKAFCNMLNLKRMGDGRFC